MSSHPKGRSYNKFLPFQRYDVICYKCHNHGHIDRNCKLVIPTKKNPAIKPQWKEPVKVWKRKEVLKEKPERWTALCAIEKQDWWDVDSG